MTLPVPSPLDAVIDRAVAEPAFRRRLLADPAAALREAGVVVPEGVIVAVLEDTPTRVHLVLPPPPEDGALSDSELDGVAGGTSVLPRPKRPSPRELFRMMME